MSIRVTVLSVSLKLRVGSGEESNAPLAGCARRRSRAGHPRFESVHDGEPVRSGYPNETALCFLPDDTALCLLRRDGAQPSAQLGSARPPYTQWSWRDLGLRIGGPQLLRVPGGRLLAAGRFHDGGVRTALAWLDPEAGSLTEFQPLPSGGDTSYPGLVWRDGRLWVSYYSSHEGKAAIYLARVRPAD